MNEMKSDNKRFRNNKLIYDAIPKVKKLWSLKKYSNSIEEQKHYQAQIDAYFKMMREELLKPHPFFVPIIPNKPDLNDVEDKKIIQLYIYDNWRDSNLFKQFQKSFGGKFNKLYPASKKEKFQGAIFYLATAIVGSAIAGAIFWYFPGLINLLSP